MMLFLSSILVIPKGLLYSGNINAIQEKPAEGEKKSEPWKIRAGLGASLTGGNSDTRIFTFDGEANKSFNAFRFKGIYRQAHGTSSYSGGPRIKTTDNWLSSARLDWFTTAKQHSFLFTFLSLDGNEFRGYFSKRTAQTGYGYKMFTNRENIDLNIALGIDYSKENLVTPNARRDEIFSVVLKPELDMNLTGDINLIQRSSIFLDMQDSEEYQIDVQNMINFRLVSMFTLRATYILNYRNKPRMIRELDQTGRPTGNSVLAKPSDHTFSFSLIVNF